MGAGRFDPDAYRTFTANTATKSTHQIYDTKGLKDSLNPRKIKVRESRDSDINPLSTPIIAAIDVTGSMHTLADVIARKGLGTLFTEIYDRKPVSDPHIMFMAVGDVRSDNAPLQVSQFEADVRIIEQLTDIYLEGGGGGNNGESYNLPWYFAAFHTSTDCHEKRGKKGYLFTIGDEPAPPDLTAEHIERVFGYKPETALSNKDLLQLVQQSYHVFHLVVEEGQHPQYHGLESVMSSWRPLLGERAVVLTDHTKLSEVIVSLIEVTEGRDADAVAASWSGDTALVVANAVRDLTTGNNGGSVVRL